MNHDHQEFDPSVQEFEAKLSRCKIAAPNMDPNVVFYNAGFAAANATAHAKLWNQRLVAAALVLVATGISSMYSYKIGRTTAIDNSPGTAIAQNPEHIIAPANKDRDITQATLNSGAGSAESVAANSVARTDWVTAACNQWVEANLSLQKNRHQQLLASNDLQNYRGPEMPTSNMTEPSDPKSTQDSSFSEVMSISRPQHSLRWSDFLPTL